MKDIREQPVTIQLPSQCGISQGSGWQCQHCFATKDFYHPSFLGASYLRVLDKVTLQPQADYILPSIATNQYAFFPLTGSIESKYTDGKTALWQSGSLYREDNVTGFYNQAAHNNEIVILGARVQEAVPPLRWDADNPWHEYAPVFPHDFTPPDERFFKLGTMGKEFDNVPFEHSALYLYYNSHPLTAGEEVCFPRIYNRMIWIYVLSGQVDLGFKKVLKSGGSFLVGPARQTHIAIQKDCRLLLIDIPVIS